VEEKTNEELKNYIGQLEARCADYEAEKQEVLHYLGGAILFELDVFTDKLNAHGCSHTAESTLQAILSNNVVPITNIKHGEQSIADFVEKLKLLAKLSKRPGLQFVLN
jgi:hypothetical protein